MEDAEEGGRFKKLILCEPQRDQKETYSHNAVPPARSGQPDPSFPSDGSGSQADNNEVEIPVRVQDEMRSRKISRLVWFAHDPRTAMMSAPRKGHPTVSDPEEPSHVHARSRYSTRHSRPGWMEGGCSAVQCSTALRPASSRLNGPKRKHVKFTRHYAWPGQATWSDTRRPQLHGMEGAGTRCNKCFCVKNISNIQKQSTSRRRYLITQIFRKSSTRLRSLPSCPGPR